MRVSLSECVDVQLRGIVKYHSLPLNNPLAIDIYSLGLPRLPDRPRGPPQ